MVPPGFFVLTFLALTAHASISVSDTIGHDLIKACREKSVATVATILRTHPAAAVFKSPQVCPVRQPGTPSLSAQCFSPPHWRQETITTAAPLSTADPRRPFAAEGAPLDVPCVFFVCAHSCPLVFASRDTLSLFLCLQTGLTGLMACAVTGVGEGVTLLLRAGAAVDAQDELGTSALAAAALKGQAGVIAQLLAAGANVNIARKVCVYVCMYVCVCVCVRPRCRACCGLSCCALQTGHTPLMIAAMAGHKDAVQYLATHGANLEAKNLVGCPQTGLWRGVEGSCELRCPIHNVLPDGLPRRP